MPIRNYKLNANLRTSCYFSQGAFVERFSYALNPKFIKANL